MITLSNRFFPVRSAVCFFVEGAIILFSVVSSFLILQKEGGTGIVSINDAFVRGIIVSVLCQSCMYLLDMYDLKCRQRFGEIFFSLVFALGTVCIGVGLISYALPAFGVEGRMYYLTILLVTVLLLIWRIFFDLYLGKIAPKVNTLIVGTGEAAKLVANELKAREKLGFRLVGFIGSSSSGSDAVGSGNFLGIYADMLDVVNAYGVRKVVVALEERRGECPVNEMLALRVTGCDVVEWPGFFEKLSGRISIHDLSPSFFVFNSGFRKSRIVLLVRRMMSLIISTVACIVLAPVFAVVSVLIKLDSPGPVFYSQERVGQHGKQFRIYKFRSMRNDSEIDGRARWATENDTRITRVGKYLRITRIDELPQLFNVIRGDIDLVGPRPERPEFVTELQNIISYYSLRHTVKPGLTGWAQIMFTYCGTVEESKEKLQYDLFYIKNMSIKLDILIMLMTLKIVLLGRGAR